MTLSIDQMRAIHTAAQLSGHPCSWVTPAVRRGELVAVCFIPLDLKLAEPINRKRGYNKKWQWKSDRDIVLRYLKSNMKLVSGLACLPLAGRPQVICTRYSSKQPDSTSAWSKVIVDCLQPGGTRKSTRTIEIKGQEPKKVTRLTKYGGLGIIANDRPKDCEVVEQWWPARPGHGFVVIEVFG